MLSKLFFSSMITFLILNIGNTFDAQQKTIKTKHTLINKFCIAALKSKLDIKDKQNLNEISNFTCECFSKKYNSGNSLKNSRIYCRNKASQKYNL